VSEVVLQEHSKEDYNNECWDSDHGNDFTDDEAYDDKDNNNGHEISTKCNLKEGSGSRDKVLYNFVLYRFRWMERLGEFISL
jgi:hypothetical protein